MSQWHFNHNGDSHINLKQVIIFVMACFIVLYANAQLFEKKYDLPLLLTKEKETKNDILLFNKITNTSNIEFVYTNLYNNKKIYYLFVDTIRHIFKTFPIQNLKDRYGFYDDYQRGSQIVCIGNSYYFFSGSFLSLYKKRHNKLVKKKILYNFDYLKNRSESYSNIFYLNNDTLVLTNTYNEPVDSELFTPYRFALFDLRKNKIIKEKSFYFHKGIILSSYWEDEKITTWHNKIAFANPTKPEFYLMDKRLIVTDTVHISGKVEFNTDSIINMEIKDEFVLKNIHNPKEIIHFVRDKKLIYLPRIAVLSFINDDLLLCSMSVYFPKIENHTGINRQKLYIYSLSANKFIDSLYTDMLPFNALYDMQLSNFNPVNFHYEINMQMDTTTEQINYSLNIFKYVGKTAFDLNIPGIQLRNTIFYNDRKQKVSFDKTSYKYALFPDELFCTHCYQNLKNETRLLILLPDGNIEQNIFQKKNYKFLFPKATVLFYRNLLPKINKNQLYLFKR